MQKMLDQKVKLANEMNGQVAVYAKKQEQDEEAIKFLKQEIEKQRRKSTADQGVIRKLQQLLGDKVKIIEQNKRRHTSLQSEIRAIQDELTKERNKSLADQATIKKLEDLLKRRIQQMNQKQQ